VGKPLKIVGIGDLHLDGKMASHVPEYNRVCIDEVRAIIDTEYRKGFKIFALLGDVFDTEVPSTNGDTGGYRLLVKLFTEFHYVSFLVIGGNHDVDSQSTEYSHSLSLLQTLVDTGCLPNVTVAIRDPLEVYQETGTPVLLLPWPHEEAREGSCNLMHTEFAGCTRDNGQPTKVKTPVPEHFCVIGHLHTAQNTLDVHWPGTLNQKNFGEGVDKRYMKVWWTGDKRTTKVEYVRHAPSYILRNVVINSLEEYEAFVVEAKAAPESTLFKVFVNSRQVLLPVNAFAGLPSVVKHNHFQSKAELNAGLAGDLHLEDSQRQHVDLVGSYQDWMRRNDVDPAVGSRSLELLESFIT
jgi:hypothetical protein